MFDFEKIKACKNNYAPVQIVHDFQFTAINVRDDYSVLKNAGPSEKLEYIGNRIRKLSDDGYGGVVVNVDFENYLENDSSFELLDRIIDIAVSRGLKVWLYDEQYYPSGSAGGLTLYNHPELEGQGLVCVRREITASGAAVRIASPHGHSELKYAFALPLTDDGEDSENKINISQYKDVAGGLCWNPPGGRWVVYCFFVRALYEMTNLAVSMRASRRFPDIANKQAIERFVKVTYEKYEKYLRSPLGSRIEAVFTDEPSIMFYREYPKDKDPDNPTRYASVSVYDRPDTDIPSYPYIPWSAYLEAEFESAYGYSICECLPEMFAQTDNKKIRMDFYRNLSSMVERAYIHTLADYVHSRNMLLSSHYLWEESFNRHPFMFGDILRHLGGMDIPGCDVLFSSPEKLRGSVPCKLASSAAHIYGREHVMIEASNMLGPDQSLTLKSITAAVAMMFVHGIDTVTSYYGENILDAGGRRIFNRYTSFLGNLFEGGSYVTDTLLYYPFEQLCAGCMPEGPGFNTENRDSLCVNDVCKHMLASGVCFDFINNEKLLESSLDGGELVTGYGQHIRQIVFPAVDFLTEETARLVTRAFESGIKIYFWGKKRRIQGIDFEPEFADETTVIKSGNIYLDGESKDIIFTHRSFDSHDLYLIVNTGSADKSFGVNLCNENNRVRIINPESREISAIESEHENGIIHFELNLPALTGYVVAVD